MIHQCDTVVSVLRCALGRSLVCFRVGRAGTEFTQAGARRFAACRTSIGRSSRLIRVVIPPMSRLLAGAHGRGGTTEPPQILPAALAMHPLACPGRDPARDFGTVPGATLGWHTLQRPAKLKLLIHRQDRCRA